jgi:hypothetical protein
VIAWILRLLCASRGHEWRTRGEQGRIVQVCDFCEAESAGVEMGAPPRQRFAGDPRRHALSVPRLVKGRRQA